MKTSIFIVFFLFIAVFGQTKEKSFIDVSPDGRIINTYPAVNGAYPHGYAVKSAAGIPFGTTPEWTAIPERQIGGMAFGDYDGDGDLDLATGCYFSNSFPPVTQYEVLIYRNDGGVLTTQPAWISTDMRSTTEVKFADIDGDGRLDLLAANGDVSFVPSVIYMNSAAGLNTTPTWISGNASFTVGAAFADVDGDGDLDLAFANQGSSLVPAKPLCIFYNFNGAFTSVPNWFSDDQMISNDVAFCDMDRSSLVAKQFTYTATGGYASFTLPLFPVYAVDSILVGGRKTTAFWLGADEGIISLAQHPAVGTQIKVYYRYESKPDMAVSKWVNYQSAIYFNNNGAMNTSPGWTIGNNNSEKGIGWFDYNKDGYNDLAISGSGVTTRVFKNNAGVIGNEVFSYTSPSGSCQKLISTDLNNDGYPEFAIVNFSSKRIEIFNNENGVFSNGAAWTFLAGTSATSIAFGDVNGDGFPDLAVGTARSPVCVFLNQNNVIPVELTSFSVTQENDKAVLRWKTATEKNNDRFVIERKYGTADWLPIGFVKGSGTTTTPVSYLFTDNNAPEGTVLYRLRQIDLDGSGYVHQQAEITIKRDAYTFDAAVFPNPASGGKISLTLTSPRQDNVIISEYNSLGERIAELYSGPVNKGTQTIALPLHSRTSGVAFITIQTSDKVKTIPVVTAR